MQNEMKDSCNCGPNCRCGSGDGARKAKLVAMALAFLMLAVWLGFKARNESKMHRFIGVPIERNVISISGEGRVVGIPDVATVDLGTNVEKKTVAEAQKENSRVMDQLIADVKAMGVESKDIQTTSYNVFPNYDWNDGKQTLRSYSVTQNVHVKVRNLDKVGDILGKAGQLGANQIGGISFAVDEPEHLKAEARDEAIMNAKEKAEALARAAGVELVRVVSFNESYGGGVPMPYYAKEAYGMGGDVATQAAAPSVEAGSSEIIANVTMTYEIR